ncbi:MAG TPA: outer membrane protein transport protein, partial [Planctomycetia bacterium]|nr:outer membrane protein transport protein [Planctomycetia bacterium]
SSMTLLQLAPTVATKLGEKLAVGFGPTIAVAVASFDPAYFGGTNDANGDGVGTFPTASHMRPFWGGGFRAGAVYSLSERIDVGFGYTSPQWYETWRAYARDEIGNPLTLNLPVTLPAIYSLGAAIRPNDELLVGADLRFFDYRTTKLFGTPIVDGGIGWESVWSIAVGGQYRLSERLAVQSGYVYNNNPIPSVGTLFNIQAPAITQNTFSCGASYSLTDALAMSLGYSYGFKNTLEGPVREATGAGVKIETSVHALLFGVQVKYGCCAARPACGEGTTLGAAVSPAPSAPSAAH